MKGDLHIHSSVSDCNYSIEEIIIKAREEKLTCISITDHDTILGNEEAIKIGGLYGVEVIPGIEISAYDYKRNSKVHVLGYGRLGKNTEKLCEETTKTRHNLSKEFYKEIKEKKYNISWERIKSYAGRSGVFKQHIMLDLIREGYTDKIYGDLYKKLFKEETEIKDMEYVDVYDAIKAIKKDGGVAVIAHPMAYKNQELILELLEKGIELDGIEVYHPKHSKEDQEALLKLAHENNLLATGGSDFHGEMEDEVNEIGCFSPEEKAVREIIKRTMI